MRLRNNISIILCTYCSEAIIAHTLRAIFSNTVLPGEIILVDNASPDETILKAKAAFDSFGNQEVDFRVLINSLPGVAKSREMGVIAARGDISVFVDDDNFLTPGYLGYVEEFFSKRPEVTMLCSKGVLPPGLLVPEGFDERKLRHYAVGSIIPETGSILDKEYIWSAGLAFRTEDLKRFFRRGLRLYCGQAKGIMAGEDSEIFGWYKIRGKEVWFSCENTFEHHINPKRFTEAYFQKLRNTQSESGTLLLYHYQPLIRFSRHLRNLGKKITLYDIRQIVLSLISMILNPSRLLTYWRILTA